MTNAPEWVLRLPDGTTASWDVDYVNGRAWVHGEEIMFDPAAPPDFGVIAEKAKCVKRTAGFASRLSNDDLQKLSE